MDKPFPAYDGDEAFAFVCYAHEDSAVVYPEIARLHEQGINLWYDEGISAGKNWRAAIGESLLGASRVLFYISRRSLESDHCNREINLALDKGKEVVPVYLEDVELTPDLMVGLNRVQALHRDQDVSYQQHLLSALGHPASAPATFASSAQRRLRWWHYSGIGLASAILIGAAWWYLDESKDSGGVEDIQAHSDQPSIAVLPFANMSADPDNLYFSDGISEEILIRLTKLSGIKVIARTSSFSFREDRDIREIGELLNVTHVLEGSVRRVDDRVRITAQLIDTTDGSHLWSQSYSRDLQDVFAVQDEIAWAILGRLEVELALVSEQATPEGSVDPAAYDAYLSGRHHFSALRWNRAIESYERAVEIAPDFAAAHGSLANVHINLLLGGWPQTAERVNAIERSVNRALELDSDEPVALAVQATTLFFADREYQAGLDAFHGLLARIPNNIDILYFAGEAFKTIGRNDLALRLGERAVELDPLSWLVLSTHGIALLSNGRFAEAEAFFLRGRKIDGRLWPGAADAAFFQGDLEKAERYMETFLADWDQEQQPGAWSNLAVAMNFAYTIGETERAKRLAQSLLDLAETKRVPDNAKSNAYYVLGDESWVTALGQALANPSYLLLSQLRVPPAFHEPEYQELLKTVGLDDQSVAKLHVQDLPF